MLSHGRCTLSATYVNSALYPSGVANSSTSLAGGDAEDAGLENAGLENVGPNRRGGKGRTGKQGTKSQGWKRQDWKTRDQIAGMEKAGLENAGTSCVRVAKCNIINVRGHVRVNVTAGRGDPRTLHEAIQSGN